MKSRTYFDHNATTPLLPCARAAMVAASDVYGNASSIHFEGRAARATIDGARRAVAGLVGCTTHDVIFTSCGTEALNIVLSPDLTLDGQPFEHLLMSAGEHPAVLKGHRFGDAATIVPLDPDGRIDLAALQVALVRLAGKRVVLALQAANNETGVVQPVRAAADMVHAAGGFVVCDAVQAVGKIPCGLGLLGADALAISAHKFGGPKGVGALCFAPCRHHISQGVVRGGGHERGLSAGTENIIGIAGMGACCEAVAGGTFCDVERLAELRGAVEMSIRAIVPDVTVFGRAAGRLPNTICFAAAGYDAQVLLMNLDLNGFAVSAGSACASGKVAPSHVLSAMGVAPDLASRAVRVSLGWTTTRAEVDAFATGFAKAIETMRPRVAA